MLTAAFKGDRLLLNRNHDLANFDCGKSALNDFLAKYALQNQTGDGARTYVLTRGAEVVGYSSLAPASVVIDDTPPRVGKGQGYYPLPVILMARFALDEVEQGKGLGKVLLRAALRRALGGADTIGGRTLVVHAKDEDAVSCYRKFGRESSPTNPFTLFLLFKDIRHTLELQANS